MGKAGKIEIWVELQPGIFAKSPRSIRGYIPRRKQKRKKPDAIKRRAQFLSAWDRWYAKNKEKREAARKSKKIPITLGNPSSVPMKGVGESIHG